MEITFKNYQTISASVQAQICRVNEIWKSHLGEQLLGIYIHGSMALGYFRENISDIDLLVVTNRRITRAERLQIAEEIIEADQKPCPLEMSALYLGDLKPWRHPTPCQFHYSEAWTERYRQLLWGEMKECFIVDTDFEDPDIACHVKLTKQSGICIFGKPIAEVFPEVPETDFWDSISQDVADYDFHAYEPKYFASNILVLGRILSYKKEKRILSKYEAGLWTIGQMPEKYHYILEDALKVWYLGKEPMAYDPGDLESLKQYLIAEIQAE